jgi:pimeloyl-ACP methyl ester carboxylesterase
VKSLFRWRPFRPTQEDHRKVHHHGKIAVNGTTLYYEMAGHGPYVVFIPNIGSDRRMWDDQVRTFARHYTVVRYDLRGYGKSALTAGSFRHAEDLIALLDALDIAQATLIGFRHGANIAVECALDHPDRVQAIVLVKPFMDHSLDRYTPGADPAFDRTMIEMVYASQEPHGVKRAAKMFGVMWRMPSYFPANTSTSETLVQDVKRRRSVMRRMLLIDLANVGRTFRIVLGRPRWPQLKRDQRNPRRQEDERYRARWAQSPALERLEEIHTPTLIVQGEYTTPSLEQVARILHDEIVGAQLVYLKGTIAYPHAGAPAHFQQVVTEFLEREVYPPTKPEGQEQEG